uniref:Uncharacterized protein n=1 Tax=Leersia perrieri TaxID=77586 RepID=A0A0D9WGU6_9ORYZ
MHRATTGGGQLGERCDHRSDRPIDQWQWWLWPRIRRDLAAVAAVCTELCWMRFRTCHERWHGNQQQIGKIADDWDSRMGRLSQHKQRAQDDYSANRLSTGSSRAGHRRDMGVFLMVEASAIVNS